MGPHHCGAFVLLVVPFHRALCTHTLAAGKHSSSDGKAKAEGFEPLLRGRAWEGEKNELWGLASSVCTSQLSRRRLAHRPGPSYVRQ